METSLAPHAVEVIPFFKNLSFGVVGLFFSLYINTFCLRRIALNYEIKSRVCMNKRNPNAVFRLYLIAIICLMLVQILIIVFWGFFLKILSLVDDPLIAVMFSGSCYTTMGLVADIMPEGWKFMAILIALSGLFAIALATAAMINMTPLFRKAWLYKHAREIQAVIRKDNIVIPDFVSIEETIKVKEEITTADTKS